MNEPIYMPDGRPVPAVMLESELVELLRLNELGISNPPNTLRYYREKHMLKGTKIGHRLCYTPAAVKDFLEAVTDKA